MWKSQIHKTSTWWVLFGKCLCLPYTLDWKCCFSKGKCVFHYQKKKISNHVCSLTIVRYWLCHLDSKECWASFGIVSYLTLFSLLFCWVGSASPSTQRRDYCTWGQDVWTGAAPACLPSVCVSVVNASHLLGHPDPMHQISFLFAIISVPHKLKKSTHQGVLFFIIITVALVKCLRVPTGSFSIQRLDQSLYARS